MKQINKNYKILTAVLFLLGFFFFTACTDEEHPTIDPRGEPGYSLVRVSIKNTGVGGSGTYAPTTFEAYPAEKEIRSVAFFTQTDDVGDYGQPGFQAGAFSRFFSDEELRSTHGLHEPLEQAGGNYTTTLKVKSDGFGSRTQLVVIANYMENGLAATLKSILTWEDLKSVLTGKLNGQHLGTPLVMYGADYNVALTDGGTVPASIMLSRVVARLDVVNQAADLVNPDNGFVLQSAQLLHPKEFGFLLPGNKQSVVIPTLTLLPPVTAGNLPENDPAKITGLYLYETDNQGTESPKTSILLKGQLFGTPFEKEIPLKKPDEVGKEGDPIGLQRNHRYQLTITSVVGEDVQWEVQVADWSTGQDIDVKPELEKPVLSKITFDNGGYENRWANVAGGHTYTYDGTRAEVIRFTASSPTHSLTYAFECELDGLGESIGLNNPMLPAYQNFIKQSEPTATYATISHEFEITLPVVLKPDEYAVPVDIKVYIRNQANRYYADTITIRCRPNYPGTQHQPVKVGGVFWAPVNVGATEIDVISPNNSVAQGGYHFQWGRNYPFDPEKTYQNIEMTATYEETLNGVYKDWFIKANTTPYDWLSTTDPGYQERNDLWSKNINTPCPKGWRLPTDQDLALITATMRSYETRQRMIIKGDETGKYLYFPRAGNRSRLNGVSILTGNDTRIWSGSQVSLTNSNSWGYADGVWQYGPGNRANGHPIRCVQSVTP